MDAVGLPVSKPSYRYYNNLLFFFLSKIILKRLMELYGSKSALQCFSNLMNLAFRAYTKDFKHTIMAQCCLSVGDSDRFPGG